MTMELAASLLQDMLFTALKVTAPILLAALSVGLLISILQAATQVNEQTLTFAPKIVLVLGTFAVLFPWIMGSVMDFAHRVMDLIVHQVGS